MTDLITLDEAKAFLRVDHTEEDDLIEQLIATATETALAHAYGLDDGDPLPESVSTSALLHVARLCDGREGAAPPASVALANRYRAWDV